MSFISQYGNDGEISGFLDVKSDHTREKGLFKAMRSPWKRRYCVAFRMVEVGPSGRKTTIRLDTYPNKQSFSRSRENDCQSYGLSDGQIVRIVRCVSSTRRYAFSIFTKEQVDSECGCNVRANLHLAGDSESDSQAWIRFFRECLWPGGKVLLEGVYDLAIIDNLASREARMTGSVYLDLQPRALVLLRQEDASTIAEWPLGVVKKVEMVGSDVAQDAHKILSVTLNPGSPGFQDQEFRFFSRKPLKELELKLLRAVLSLKEQQICFDSETGRAHGHRSLSILGSTPDFCYGSSFQRHSMPSEEFVSGRGPVEHLVESGHVCHGKSSVDGSLEESQEDDVFAENFVVNAAKTRASNNSCPEKFKARPLPGIPSSLDQHHRRRLGGPADGDFMRRGSRDDTMIEINRRRTMLQSNRQESVGSRLTDSMNSDAESVDSGAVMSPRLTRQFAFAEGGVAGERREERGDSGTHSLTEDWPVDLARDARADTVTWHAASTNESGASEESSSDDTIEPNRNSQTFEEDGEVYQRLKEEGKTKDLRKYLGLDDGSKPRLPERTVTRRKQEETGKRRDGKRARRRKSVEEEQGRRIEEGHGEEKTERRRSTEDDKREEAKFRSAPERRHSSRSLDEGSVSTGNDPLRQPGYDVPAKQATGRGQPPAFARQSSKIAKNPSLFYDHVASAAMSDELEIILKQQEFFKGQMQQQTELVHNHSIHAPFLYDVPAGCYATDCPACKSEAEASRPQLPKKKNKDIAPKLPPKSKEISV